jgi:phage terminase small subunit
VPRKSAVATMLQPSANARSNRLPPPSDLDPATAAVWRRLIGSCHPDHFNHSDVELIRAYVEAAVLAQEAYAEMRAHGRIIDGRPSPWLPLLEKTTRTLAGLAPRLRLGPSARTDPKTTTRQQNGMRPSIYDTLNLDDVEQ